MQGIHLDYFPRERVRRRWIARCAFFTACGVIALLAMRWVPSAVRRTEIYLLQQQCLAYEAPRDAHVFAVPQCWSRFYEKLSPPGFFSCGTLLLHELRAPCGNRRLVSIDLALADVGPQGALQLVPRVFDIGTPVRLPRELPRDHEFIGVPSDASMFAAQVDREDKSHFTFRYFRDGKEYLVDGWLSDDDTVTLEHRLLAAIDQHGDAPEFVRLSQ